jgi:L,D-peptidoglycan transpeptidase YkuD (ErfK/YbiS/YcfS/YnhG family)
MTNNKREGDGATPRGCFRIMTRLIRPGLANRVRCLLPTRVLNPMDGWCDDPKSSSYNRAVRKPFASSHESLWRGDALYDVILVLDYNFVPRRRGKGSAIFFHLSREDRGATDGCVVISGQDMRRLLPRLKKWTWIQIG